MEPNVPASNDIVTASGFAVPNNFSAAANGGLLLPTIP